MKTELKAAYKAHDAAVAAADIAIEVHSSAVKVWRNATKDMHDAALDATVEAARACDFAEELVRSTYETCLEVLAEQHL